MVSFKSLVLLLLSVVIVSAKPKTVMLPVDPNFIEDGAECLPCNSLFTQLRTVGDTLVQDTEVHLRGEPKMGTGFIFYSVIALLKSTCNYLEKAFGPDVCTVRWVAPEVKDKVEEQKYIQLMFKSKQRGANTNDNYLNCPCPDMSAQIIFNSTRKHDLPVDDSCPWVWQGNIVSHRNHSAPCSSLPEEKKPLHPIQIDECIEDYHCEQTDKTLQAVIMRDPRASIVSAYFHMKRVGNQPKGIDLDEWVVRSLPNLCKRVLVRFAVFRAAQAKGSSILYEYDEVTKNPEAFHRSLGESVGLNLPDFIIKKSVGAVQKPLDKHKGGVQPQARVKVGFEAEIRPETLEKMNAIMRHWFSQDQLAKWGIEAEE